MRFEYPCDGLLVGPAVIMEIIPRTSAQEPPDISQFTHSAVYAEVLGKVRARGKASAAGLDLITLAIVGSLQARSRSRCSVLFLYSVGALIVLLVLTT